MHHLVVYKLICLIQDFLQEQADLNNNNPMTPENKQQPLAKTGKIMMSCMTKGG